MKNIFGICYGAIRQSPYCDALQHDCKIVMNIFEYNNDAYNQYWQLVQQKYPKEEGWYNHYVVCDWATLDQIKECLEN